MCICVYICVYVYICICMCICMHKHTHTHAHTHTHTHTHTHSRMHMHTHTHICCVYDFSGSVFSWSHLVYYLFCLFVLLVDSQEDMKSQVVGCGLEVDLVDGDGDGDGDWWHNKRRKRKIGPSEEDGWYFCCLHPFFIFHFLILLFSFFIS